MLSSLSKNLSKIKYRTPFLKIYIFFIAIQFCMVLIYSQWSWHQFSIYCPSQYFYDHSFLWVRKGYRFGLVIYLLVCLLIQSNENCSYPVKIMFLSKFSIVTFHDIELSICFVNRNGLTFSSFSSEKSHLYLCISSWHHHHPYITPIMLISDDSYLTSQPQVIGAI